jgi:hypothetical protein
MSKIGIDLAEFRRLAGGWREMNGLSGKVEIMECDGRLAGFAKKIRGKESIG